MDTNDPLVTVNLCCVYLCTAQAGRTPDRLRGSVGTSRLGQCVPGGTPPHTGASAEDKVRHR